MHLLTSTVGRKILMAVTGLLLVGFITVHLLGNLSVFAGSEAINIYAEKLHSLGPVVWIFRLVMLALFAVHIVFGIQLTVQNSSATPDTYAIKNFEKATFSSRSMIWTGSILGAFLFYHLLHFTVRVVHTDAISAVNNMVNGRPDVFTMIANSFSSPAISVVYALAMVALGFHLFHGIQSLVQTIGLNNGASQEKVTYIGRLAGIAFAVIYIAIPFAFLANFLKV